MPGPSPFTLAWALQPLPHRQQQSQASGSLTYPFLALGSLV